MNKHVQLLGVLYIVYHAVGLVAAAIIWTVLSSIGALSGDPAAFGVLTLIGTAVATLLFVLSAPGVICGIGILKHSWWARYLALILSFFNLFHIPLGTVLAIYSFWVLMQDEAVAVFEPERIPVPGPAEPAA